MPERPLLRVLDEMTVEAAIPSLPDQATACRSRRRTAVLPQRNQYQAPLRIRAAGLFQGRHQRLHRDGNRHAVNPAGSGTKCAAHFDLLMLPGEKKVVRLRCRKADATGTPFGDFEQIFSRPTRGGDEFYDALQKDIRRCRCPSGAAPGAGRACSGRSSSTISMFADGSPATRCSRSLLKAANRVRNTDWPHLNNRRHHRRCRTNGSIPGTPPGISPFIA